MSNIEKVVGKLWAGLADGHAQSNKELVLSMLYYIQQVLNGKTFSFDKKLFPGLEGEVLEKFFSVKSMDITSYDKELNPFSALEKTNREVFVPDGCYSYINAPVSLANNQTISAPYTVLTFGIVSMVKGIIKKIFEGGVGSGYHLAYMGNLYPMARLFGSDAFEDFCELAENNIKKLDNINKSQIAQRMVLKAGDCLNPLGNAIFMDNRPYDLIYFSFMMPNDFDIKPYFDSLTEGGILIAPIHSPIYAALTIGPITLFMKSEGKINSVEIVNSSFVPAVRDNKL